jgi:hypothetical protein
MRAHVRHTHATPAMGSHSDAAQSARTRNVIRAELSSAPTRAAHATRSARPDRLRKRTVTASVVVAHGQSAQPPADAPTPPPAAPPPPSPADQPAATPPAAAPPAPNDDNKVGSGASGDPGKGSGSGHAYGREKNAADQTAPPAPADGKGNANGKKKDAAPPPAAPPAAATPPSAPATAPPAAAPPAAPAEPAPAQAEDHGNGQDNGHGGGKDKSK